MGKYWIYNGRRNGIDSTCCDLLEYEVRWGGFGRGGWAFGGEGRLGVLESSVYDYGREWRMYLVLRHRLPPKMLISATEALEILLGFGRALYSCESLVFLYPYYVV